MSRPAIAFAALFAAFAIVVLLTARVANGPASLGDHIVLTSGAEPDVAEVNTSVRQFRDAGFSVTSDAAQVLARLTPEDSSVTVLTVTRQSAAALPQGVYQDLYESGVVIVGLDISMRELSRLIYGYELSTGMLPYTPGMPVFSMMRSNCGSSGRTSDWLRSHAGLAELALSRVRDNCQTS